MLKCALLVNPLEESGDAYTYIDILCFRSPFVLPGAVAAASREMRPVEIVGLYEEQREGLEVELGSARQEVRATGGSRSRFRYVYIQDILPSRSTLS